MTGRRAFAGLMTAQGVSLFGSRMTFLALPWLVLASTGSATLTGVVGFAEMLPYVVACAAGGPLIDRLGPRRMAIAMDVASTVAVGGIALLARTPAAPFGALVALVALTGLLRGTGDTAKRVVFPETVTAGRIDLARATAIQDGINRASVLVGAPIAGLLIAVTNPSVVLAIDAVSFAGCALIVALVVPAGRPMPAQPRTAPRRASYVGQLREGGRFVRGNRLTLGIMIMLFVTNLLDQANATVFVPVWSKEIYGSPVGMGLISASFAAGAVLGNVAYLALAPRLPRFAPYAVGFLIGGAPRLVAMAINTPLWTILAVGFAAGVGLSVVNPILGAVMYERIPAPLQARVFGLSTALSWAGIPLGSLLGGWLADAPAIGVRGALLIAAAAYLAATLLPFTSRVWREMDRPRPDAVASPKETPGPTVLPTAPPAEPGLSVAASASASS